MGKRAKRALQITEWRVNLILVLMAAWMGAMGVAIWARLLRAEPALGLGNGQMAAGWLGIAGTLGFAIWAIGLGLPPGNGVRRASGGPLALVCLVGVAAAFGLV